MKNQNYTDILNAIKDALDNQAGDIAAININTGKPNSLVVNTYRANQSLDNDSGTIIYKKLDIICVINTFDLKPVKPIFTDSIAYNKSAGVFFDYSYIEGYPDNLDVMETVNQNALDEINNRNLCGNLKYVYFDDTSYANLMINLDAYRIANETTLAQVAINTLYVAGDGKPFKAIVTYSHAV